MTRSLVEDGGLLVRCPQKTTHTVGRGATIAEQCDPQVGRIRLQPCPRNRERYTLYLLRQLTITRPNPVWASDLTYIPMQRGFVYRCVILDWASRRVLAWRLSNTLTTDFCVDAVQEAITRYGSPEIFNTGQGCQFTSQEFTGVLKDQGIQISMNGTGRWRDHVFVERLWRSLKYEEVYLHAYEMIRDAQEGGARSLTFYNQIRPHRALDGRTPDRVYWDNQPARPTAA